MRMRKRLLAFVLLLSMILTILPTAVMAVDTAPQVEDLSISGGANTVTKTNVNGSLVFTAPANSQVTDYTATVTLSDGAVLTPTSHQEGQLYVASATETSATLKFDLMVNDVNLSESSTFDLVLTAANGVWTGGLTNAETVTLQALADNLENQEITLAAGALGTGSPSQVLLMNQDAANVMLVLCSPDAAVYTVNYVVDDTTTITWKLPDGMVMPVPTLELVGGDTLQGWCTDADRETPLAADATVTGDTTLYAKIEEGSASGSGDFLTDLTNGNTAVILTDADWDLFVANADQARDGQLVILGTNIDCDGAVYDPLDFKGDFSGLYQNEIHSISNASFRSVLSGYYSSSEEDIYCSGLFEAIGPGQIIANLELNNITAQYSATYAGILAGLADGASNDRALIQNVQVRGGSASGRTAAGVVGFTRNATVRYCSSRDTTITGLANGGGIVGINNAKVEYCYSTTSPTALPTLFGGSTGGVVAKKVRGGWCEYCWATMTVVGASDVGGTDIGALEVGAASMPSIFTEAGFTQNCWVISIGTATDFNYSNINYDFFNNT